MIQIDIDMPEKCGLCPLFHAEHPMYCQGVKADRKKKIVAPYGQPRPDWCPLHEVTADPDTVSRKQAIDALKDTYGLSYQIDGFSRLDAVEIIKNLPPSPTPSRPHWIPCSERLPEVGAVLITDGNEILIGEYYGDSTWSVDGCDYNPDLEKIAWMPLPEPYHNI